MQPTAMSASASSSATGTAPVEWQRSHWTSAPASCAALVRAGRSNIAPDRKSTWVRASSATSSSSEAAGSAGSHHRISRSSIRATPAATYPSVGNVVGSSTTTRRPGRSRLAATKVLNNVTLVESPTCTSAPSTPIRGAIRAPTRRASPTQSAVFHEEIRPAPHSSATTCCMRPATDRGSAPSELPSR